MPKTEALQYGLLSAAHAVAAAMAMCLLILMVAANSAARTRNSTITSLDRANHRLTTTQRHLIRTFGEQRPQERPEPPDLCFDVAGGAHCTGCDQRSATDLIAYTHHDDGDPHVLIRVRHCHTCGTLAPVDITEGTSE